MKRILRAYALGAIVLASVALGAAAPAAAGVDFKNFSYAHHPCGPNPVPMRGGHGDYPDKDPRVDPGTVFGLGWLATHGGRIGTRNVAVVALYCETHPGTNQSADVYAIDGSRATYLRHVADIYTNSGSWALDQWIHVRFAGDQLFVDARNSGEDAASPLWTVTTYRLQGNTLRAVYKLVHKRAT
jgi:hypothetical protein